MKIKSFFSLLLFVLLAGTIQAQTFTSAADALRYIEDNAKEIYAITNGQTGRLNAARSALQNGNANLFTSKVNDAIANLDRVEELSDELNTGSFQAAQLDPNASNSFLLGVGGNIEALQDAVVNNILAAVAANDQGDTAGAIAAIDAASAALQQQNALADQAIEVARTLCKSL